MTNFKNITAQDYVRELFMKFGTEKPLKLFFKVKYSGILYKDVSFSIFTIDNKGNDYEILLKEKESKKQYDGSYIFTIDVSNKDYNNYFLLLAYEGFENITFYYLTAEFKESFLSFDIKAYKNAISEYI